MRENKQRTEKEIAEEILRETQEAIAADERRHAVLGCTRARITLASGRLLHMAWPEKTNFFDALVGFEGELDEAHVRGFLRVRHGEGGQSITTVPTKDIVSVDWAMPGQATP